MSDEISIKSTGLGIRYRRYMSKALTLKENALSLFRANKFETFWALRDLDLELHKGDSLGVIGPNGAGKSTLLKAIARVLKPSEGSIQTYGRIAPLLELGAGFRNELTGRENIFLNGAIMGLSKAEMAGKVNGIIEFSDLGDFIDAPLTTYSSGMRARLGFAVATDIDPQILLVDEVLSVGDAAFKARAQERTEHFFRSNRTVVLVSHSLDQVANLCNRVLYLNHGQKVALGGVDEVLSKYREDIKFSIEASKTPKKEI